MTLLVKKGFNPKMGARPLARIIDQEVKKPMSREMLFGILKTGGVVEVDAIDKDVKLNYRGTHENQNDGQTLLPFISV
jgi:ATP-dependent Clp protease ATP-binding subunit ClpA